MRLTVALQDSHLHYECNLRLTQTSVITVRLTPSYAMGVSLTHNNKCCDIQIEQLSAVRTGINSLSATQKGGSGLEFMVRIGLPG